ncbi:hypothetical protein Hypma_016226 [Hypsizygus marmoreus]|uniref:Centromere protein Scm3 n=1 Tax=Hypsizygus marmoreus TaxID=39966 RepID=A0A369IXX0_HYPMA|nr:hypothetical protein Hypma_016226 [Hypsizygus marmoreus]
MDSDVSLKRSEPTAALITPSASPPSRSFFPQPYRIPDQASPTKRPRLSSTPRQLQPHASTPSSSSASADTALDFHQAREASTMRLLDVWSSLADRYSRPLDQDDIIDLTTGKVIKDRGVIRGSQNFAVGCFANAIEDDEEENDDEDDEDDVDELDSFANSEGPVNLEVDVRVVPPVTEMDPADAEDLREFMEAETRRRAVCGSEPEDTEGSSVYEEEIYSESSRGGSVYIARTDTSPFDRDATSGVDEDDYTHENEETSLRHPVPEFVDSGSDDELGGWEVDEASMVYRMPKKEEEANDSDSDIEFVDPPPKPKSPYLSAPPPPSMSKNISKFANQTTPKPKKPFIPRQLQTPPQSQASSHPSATPSDDYFTHLPPESSSPPRTSSSPPRTSSSPPRTSSSPPRTSSPPQTSSPPSSLFASSPIKQPPERNTIKPHSERKRNNSSHASRAASSPPIPRLDLSQVSQRRRGRPSKSTPQDTLASASGQEASNSASASLPKLKKPSAQRSQRSRPSASGSNHKGAQIAPKQSQSQIEVVIEQPRFRTPSISSSKETPRQTRRKDAQDAVQKEPPMAGKGKEKEVPIQNWDSVDAFERVEESDDPITLSSSPVSVAKGSVQSHRCRQPQAPSASASTSRDHPKPSPPDAVGSAARKPKYGEVVSEAPPKPTKKRKRVASSAETNSVSLEVEPSQDVGGSSHTRGRIGSVGSVGSSTGGEAPQPEAPEIERKQKSKRKSTPPKLRSRPSEHHYSSGDTSQEEFEEQQRHFSRAPSHFNLPPPLPHDASFHPYSQPSFTPHHSHQQPPFYAPIPDPRAQFIISQAMHQLSALVSGGPWTPQVAPPHSSAPHTPSHYRHYRDPASSMYSTPTHHPHPYPYSYDPNISRATLPPDSPPVHSSPVTVASSSSGHIRPKSLVRRSQSRGRRVSFRIEEGVVEDTLDFDDSSGKRSSRSVNRGRNLETSGSRSEPQRRTMGKGKGKEKERQNIEVVPDSESESGSEPEMVAPRRGRPVTRAQTPGPSPVAASTREEQRQSAMPKRARSRSGTGRVKS